MAIPRSRESLTAQQVLATGAAIVAMQEDWCAAGFPGGQTDPWDHIESAMALSVTGFHAEAEAAYDWSRRHQRADGSGPSAPSRAGSRTQHRQQLLRLHRVGVWHHYQITGDTGFWNRMWPAVVGDGTGTDVPAARRRDFAGR